MPGAKPGLFGAKAERALFRALQQALAHTPGQRLAVAEVLTDSPDAATSRWRGAVVGPRPP